MKKGGPVNIVCCALPAWEADYSRSTVELMKCLSTENKVLYVDYAYTITDLVKGIFGRKKFEWKRLLGIKKRLRKISGSGDTGLFVLSLPPLFPSFIFQSYKLFVKANKLNAALAGYFINRAIRKLDMQSVISFNSFQPFLGRHLKIRRQTFSVYYIYDDFSGVSFFKGFSKLDEDEFIKKADLVIVSSAELKRRIAHINKPVEVVNNGVHFDAFNIYTGAKKLNGNYIKTVGYTGTMDSRIDIALLEYLVKEIPDARFLFVGKVMDKAIHTRLSKYINVCFEPPVSADQIPIIQSQVHVGIVPYLCNALTAAIYPLKVNEYLAMGLPVVMTPFASLGAADELIYIANDQKDFKRYLEQALLENDTSLKQARLDVAKEADWKMRTVELLNFISVHRQNKEILELNQQTKNDKENIAQQHNLVFRS
jgi:glycosyltransferase involved in cell wall biosynthesis